MQISALLTSAGINIGVCVLLFSLYSILRKQPSNASVYFGRQLASGRNRPDDPFCMDRFVPSPSWILKAWQTTEEEILAVGGMDAVVFLRIVVFSLRVFSVAAVICMFVLLPMNYYGQEMQHKQIPSEELEVFTIANVKEGSTWFGAHCLALYVISCSACVLLYFEYKSITKMRLAHITNSPANPSHFTVLVRSIPWSPKESYGDMVKKFFTNYYASSYLSHQMVYRSGTYHKLMDDAEQMCRRLKSSVQPACNLKIVSCGLCGDNANSFKKLTQEGDSVNSVNNVKSESHLTALESVRRKKECAAAFVFFKTRYAADVAADVLQSSNPMLWVTELAPEPHDILWSNLGIPYRQLWIRKIATLIAAIVFMFVFLIPVAFIQGMTQLEQLSEAFPFLKGILKKPLMNQLVTGYLPSVILMTFLYAVPPTMMLFSVLEGPVSRSGRKKSACLKVLFFTIWNVFFVNILSGSVIRQLSIFSSVRDIPQQLAKAVPTQASFFMTYVLSSGWAGLACELMQLFPLTCNLLKKFVFRMEDEPTYVSYSFPYHTEIPRILLFGLLGFTCSIMAPLIVPLLLIYFFLAYLIYRNQILNVYFSKYESGGQFWPIAHNTTIFSLVLTQIIALGVFGMKQSPVASGFTVPLIIFTLLFSEYCRQRFFPIFKKNAAQVLMEMDRQDEQSGRLQEIYNQLYTAYSRYPMASPSIIIPDNRDCPVSCPDPESLKQGLIKGKEIISEENKYGPIIDLK